MVELLAFADICRLGIQAEGLMIPNVVPRPCNQTSVQDLAVLLYTMRVH
jgi:hypothetical protein